MCFSLPQYPYRSEVGDSMLTNTNVRRHPFQNIEEVELSGLFDLMRLKNPTILDINDITDTYKAGSCLYLHLEINIDGRFKTKLYDN
jgi:hypothetical protein